MLNGSGIENIPNDGTKWVFAEKDDNKKKKKKKKKKARLVGTWMSAS